MPQNMRLEPRSHMESSSAQPADGKDVHIGKRMIAYATLQGVTCHTYSRCAAPLS